MKDSPQPHSSSAPLVSDMPYRWKLWQLTDVWVFEHKALVQLVLDIIHLTSDDAKERLAVDQDLDTILLNRLVKGAWLFNIFEMVRQAAASSVPYTDLDQLRLGLVKQFS